MSRHRASGTAGMCYDAYMFRKTTAVLLSLSMFSSALMMNGCGTPALPSKEAIVLPSDDAGEQEWLNQTLDSFLNDGDVLPYGADWRVLEGNAFIEDNVIHKYDQAREYEHVVLEARTANGTYTYDNLTLLDPYVGYVMSYFSPDGDDKEQLKLCYTYDSLYWFKCNEGKPVLAASLGTKRLRDPSLVRKKDGTFALLATQGYDNPEIYVFDSQDLITYENERLLKVNESHDDLKMSEAQSWAPEAFYDRTIDRYVIYWSSVKDGGMYFNTSSDLSSFSPCEKLLDAGYPVIDGTFVKNGHDWTILLKDEREPMEEYSKLFEGTGSSWNSITQFSSPVYDRHQVEGPFLMKALDKTGWYLYCDDYTRGAYKALYTEDLKYFAEISDARVMLPVEDPAHGYAIPVTWRELSRLIEVYDS